MHVLSHPATADAAAPQRQVIEHVTHGETLAATGDHTGALTAAIRTAERRRLPHQLQRVIRAANNHRLHTVAEHGMTALQRLRTTLAPTA